MEVERFFHLLGELARVQESLLDEIGLLRGRLAQLEDRVALQRRRS
jgi:hypothetical protein